jgi:hypothetical protein
MECWPKEAHCQSVEKLVVSNNGGLSDTFPKVPSLQASLFFDSK